MNNSSRITREDCQSWVISYPDLCGEVRRKAFPIDNLLSMWAVCGLEFLKRASLDFACGAVEGV